MDKGTTRLKLDYEDMADFLANKREKITVKGFVIKSIMIVLSLVIVYLLLTGKINRFITGAIYMMIMFTFKVMP